MNNRLLAEGTDVTYDGLKAELQDGEVLVATWLHYPGIPIVYPDVPAASFQGIMNETEAGLYSDLRWFARVKRSQNYFDYNG